MVQVERKKTTVRLYCDVWLINNAKLPMKCKQTKRGQLFSDSNDALLAPTKHQPRCLLPRMIHTYTSSADKHDMKEKDKNKKVTLSIWGPFNELQR